MRRRDWVALGVVVAWTGGMIAYRSTVIEPRAWGVLCEAAGAPVVCLPRAGVLWLARESLWGLGALALGFWAFMFRGPFWVQVAAVLMGVGGVINYNVTWAMAGLALGAWVWVEGPGQASEAKERG